MSVYLKIGLNKRKKYVRTISEEKTILLSICIKTILCFLLGEGFLI